MAAVRALLGSGGGDVIRLERRRQNGINGQGGGVRDGGGDSNCGGDSDGGGTRFAWRVERRR